MIKIGELSKLTNISVKTIRFYEEEGLITPVEVDRWTSNKIDEGFNWIKLPN